jgi:ABC-2 type transport system ATP-binding protein
VIVQTINLTKRYGKLVAINNLHLNIEEGECFGYIGPNGAGKTTTIRVLARRASAGMSWATNRGKSGR